MMSDFEKNAKLYTVIVEEIGRLSMLLYSGVPAGHSQALGMLINHLAAILLGIMDVSDFHEEISDQLPAIREFYYKLLYLVEP
jgi:hypothetical protein